MRRRHKLRNPTTVQGSCLIVLILLLAGGCRFNPPKAKYLLKPVVLLQSVLGGKLTGGFFRGSGTIILNRGEYTYILTCKHLLDHPLHDHVEAGTGERGDDWEFQDAEVVGEPHEEHDAVIVRTARLALPQVTLGDGVPRLFAKEYTTGWSPALDEIMAFPGEVIMNRPALVVSGQATGGCSGGSVFAQDGDDWVAVGLVTNIGVFRSKPEVQLHHVVVALPMVALLPWIRETLENAKQSEVKS